jgi:predicted Zn-dependent protease
MNKTCFVIQPFNTIFNDRFEDTFSPAIKNAGLIPYRVDRDPNAVIPIDSIEEGIKNADIVFADITTDNPNVWYELGFAIACDKQIVMACNIDERTGKFPFDIQHRKILTYKSTSKSEYDKLEVNITQKLTALIKNPAKPKFAFGKIPKVLEQYLADFPAFDLPVDINRGFVRTSRESFFRGLQCVLQGLDKDDKVISTDSINLEKFSQYLQYWAKEGLPYLKLNLEASQRGVQFVRIFVIDSDEYLKNQNYIFSLAKLHKAAGVEPRYIYYQHLSDNPTYLREFAVFGNKFVDETIYDIRSYRVIDNYIHWASDMQARFTEIAKMIYSLSNSFKDIAKTKRVNSDVELEQFAEKCLKEKIAINA